MKAAYLAWVFALPFPVQLTIGIVLVFAWGLVIVLVQRSPNDLKLYDWRLLLFEGLLISILAFPPAWLVAVVCALPAAAVAVGWSLSS
ncbi:MAG: hypothetical protein ACM3NH_04980 [Candidatus Saccharibacteria bacterium]